VHILSVDNSERGVLQQSNSKKVILKGVASVGRAQEIRHKFGLKLSGQTWGRSTWEVGCAGAERVVAKGRTSDLKGAQVVTAGTLNGTSMTEVLLREGFKEHRFGAGGLRALIPLIQDV